MPVFGLIGYPLTHSFSKKYFSEKFLKQGLTDHKYELFSIESIEALPEILAKHPDLRGLNVTIPYKQQVIPYLNTTEFLPAGINACNCIKIESGRLEGYNTDVIGFEKSFEALLLPHHTKALILGNGGATAAVAYVLRKKGIQYKIVSRNPLGADALPYSALDEHTLRAHTVIINTTPLGTFPDTNVCPSIPYQYIGSDHYLFDLVYNPNKTLFLQKGEDRGAAIKNGYEMLEIQADESWNIWNS